MPLPTLTPNHIELAPGDDITLRFKTWQDYEQLLAQRQDKAGLRIRYNATTQELRIMSPLPRHGKDADLMADFVKALLKHDRKDWEAFTPITLKLPEQQGVEPDYCFYIDNRLQILGKERLDLTTDPAPDLVLEVDLTSLTRPEDYQAIAPAELWIYRQNSLRIYRFSAEGFVECDRSPTFPQQDLKTLIPEFIERGWQAGSSVALREFETQLMDTD